MNGQAMTEELPQRAPGEFGFEEAAVELPPIELMVRVVEGLQKFEEDEKNDRRQ